MFTTTAGIGFAGLLLNFTGILILGMKKLLILMVALMWLGTAEAQRVYDGGGRLVGRVDGERYYSGSGRMIGRVRGQAGGRAATSRWLVVRPASRTAAVGATPT